MLYDRADGPAAGWGGGIGGWGGGTGSCNPYNTPSVSVRTVCLTRRPVPVAAPTADAAAAAAAADGERPPQ